MTSGLEGAILAKGHQPRPSLRGESTRHRVDIGSSIAERVGGAFSGETSHAEQSTRNASAL